MDVKDTHRTLQQLRLVTKYGMTGICLLMTAHCGMLYFGYDSFLVHILFVAFVLYIAIYLSRIFGLCWVHKLSIVYTIAVLVCIVMRRHGTFDTLGIDIHLARGIMFIIGLSMLTLNLWKAFSKKNSLKSC